MSFFPFNYCQTFVHFVTETLQSTVCLTLPSDILTDILNQVVLAIILICIHQVISQCVVVIQETGSFHYFKAYVASWKSLGY